MYKIYIGGTPLFLKSAAAIGDFSVADEKHLVARYPGKPKFLLNYVDMLEKDTRFEAVTLYAADIAKLFADFSSFFKIIEAAGGLVLNPAGAALFIFRRQTWDLPKGKIEEGESPQVAAMREVQEETGLTQLLLSDLLGETYHTYREKDGKRILKRTYWYRMHTEQLALLPQASEEIEQAVWRQMTDVLANENNIYGNIRDVLEWAKKS